ncbi:MAG: biotin--[acetyl-CoA-carboxylase] ligase [Bacteroidetes bacterium]|jgi:BirA family biotin operon repressor/biotin-[acetyl-CoA-carboxylase] ligase|nr:biotin--[acetyl-CoA-carboxylase] ligase [Bacteroidota bacterium]MCK4406722.1 biotin--[acetyl-CoA-carboxylase] ligase [Bacteroidales bacterium]
MDRKRTIGANIINLDSVDSTNSYAAKMMPEDRLPEGTVIVAKTQHAGKGQDKNYWESAPFSNLTFSVVLYPDFLAVEKQFILNKFVALAVYDFVKSFIKKHKVSIKWPNDIYIDEKKVAGILINNTIQGNVFDYSIIGIGLNINQIKFNSEAPNPVSLINILKEHLNLKNCLDKLCIFLEKRYFQLRSGQEGLINSDYLKSMFRFQSFHKYKFKDKIIEAKITNVSEFGKLILETRDSEKIECDIKEVSFILKKH